MHCVVTLTYGVRNLSNGEEFVSADLNDAAAVERLMPGIDCVVAS